MISTVLMGFLTTGATVLAAATIVVGVILTHRASTLTPAAYGAARKQARWLLGLDAAFFVGLFATAFVLLALPGDAAAQEAATAAAALEPESLATGIRKGLGYVGAGLATGCAAIGAGIGVGIAGAAGIGAISEKPEMLGKSLIYVGLAEGVAIYGLLISFMILNRV